MKNLIKTTAAMAVIVSASFMTLNSSVERGGESHGYHQQDEDGKNNVLEINADKIPLA